MCVYVCVPTHTYTQSVLFIWGFLFPFYQRAPSFIVSCPFGSFWSTEGLGNMSDGQGRMNFGVVNIHSARVHWPLLPSLTLLTHHPLEQDKKKNNRKRRWVYRSLAATTGLFFLKHTLWLFACLESWFKSNSLFLLKKKKKKRKEKINSRTWRNSHWPCLSRSAHTVLSLGPKSGSWKQSEQQSGYPFSLFSFFFFFFTFRNGKHFFPPSKLLPYLFSYIGCHLSIDNNT